MNEAIFLIHILLVLFFLGLAVRLGSGALFVYVAFSGVLANLFVVKQMVLFGLHVTCSDVFAISGILGLNLLQELYGKATAARAIRYSLFSLILFVFMSQVHLCYVPSIYDRSHESFQLILNQTPRIVTASLVVYYTVQRFDLVFFAFLKRWVDRFGLRVMISLLVSQCLDTVLFSFLGLYGIVESVFDIILVSFTIKCLIILCSSPAAVFCKRYIWKEAQ